MNESSEAAESGTGGWLDAVTYMAGLSGGSWATATFIANGGQLPTDMVDDVRSAHSGTGAVLTVVAVEPRIKRHLPRQRQAVLLPGLALGGQCQEGRGLHHPTHGLLGPCVSPQSKLSCDNTNADHCRIAEKINPPEFRLDNNPNFTLSNLTTYRPQLAQGEMPMPIIVAAE